MNMPLIDNSTATRLHWGNDKFPSGCEDLKEACKGASVCMNDIIGVLAVLHNQLISTT